MDITQGDRTFYEILQSPGASHSHRGQALWKGFSPYRTGLYTFRNLLQNSYSEERFMRRLNCTRVAIRLHAALLALKDD